MSFFKGVSDRIRRTFSASYKQPPSEQVRQAERGEAWYRDFDWESFMASYFAGTRYIPGIGLGLITYPYVSVWEKVWGAVPIEDYSKYREYMTKDPFIRATLDLHTMMCTSGGFELDYPVDMVIEDMMNFLRRHDFINILKILVRDMLTFGNAYCEIVRVWMCTSQDHDLEQLKPSYEIEGADGKKVWYTDRMDVAEKHKELYPDHELINPYGEIVRLKPLDPYFMRVRRDAWGTVLGYAQLYAVPIVTFLADEILHLRYMPSTEMYGSVYGESMLRPILYHEELLKEYEETISQIMKVYVKPMFLVKVGSPTGGPEVTAEQFREIMRSFSSRKPGSDVFIRTTGLITDVQPINPPISGLQTTQFWLEWLHNQRAYALTVPKHFVAPEGLNRACYVEDTYVLTENGWKLHNEVKEGEKIVVYEPESGRAWLEKPIKLYAYDYDGEIIHFVDKNTDIAVTPEHKIVYKKNLDGKWLTGHAEDIIGSQLILPNSMEWEGHEEEWEIIPSIELKEGFRTEFRENVKVKMDDFLSFVGIYLSEGGMDTVNHHLFTIAQTKKNVEKIEKIRTILSKLPFHYHEYEDKDCVRWNVDGKQLCTFLSSNFGERCYNKHIPSKYKNLSKRQLKILFDSMILGDGSIDKKGSITYYTTSEQLAKDFLEIVVKLGYSASISYHDDKRGGNRRRVYRIFVSKRKLKYVPKNRIVKEHYKGKVYCFSTSTGFYVTMRNGKVAYQGNTAQMVQEAYFTFIQSIRNSIASQLEQDLFPKIMYSLYGEMAKVLMDEFGVPKIVWKPVREESFASKVPLIINLKKSGIIDTNEARTMLGLKPKEEYEEEEEEGEGGMELPLPPHGEKPPPSPPPTEKGTPEAPEEAGGEGARAEEKEEGGKKKEDQLKKIIEDLKRKL